MSIRARTPIKLPIGISNFAELIEEQYTFVDKTLLIDEIIETGAKVTLIARPRRFGKTLNLSMLQHFFTAEAYGQATKGLFEALAVADRSEAMAHQGQYPVIFFSFKDIKVESFAAFEATMRVMLSSLFNEYRELTDSQRLSARDRKAVDALLSGEAALAEMANSFQLLSRLLGKHHERKTVILLDEYDTPIHAAYTHGFYSQVVAFMRNLLGAALKDNPYLFKSVITGILRVSKESLFSDLNNIEVHTVLDEGYSERFGFTEAEVASLLEATGLEQEKPDLAGQIRDWYDGYRFGGRVIYNPWSIVNCLKQKGQLKPYWINTSGNTLLKKLTARADPDFKEGLEWLIQDVPVSEFIDPSLVFGDLEGNSTALWSLLLFSGYLTAEEVRFDADGRALCRLSIPNYEIGGLYRRHIEEWFSDRMGIRGYYDFLRSLVDGDIAEFEARLRDYLLESMSLFDVQGRHPEKFYHGLVLGMIAGLRESHVIHSNRESGHGRYDVALFPKTGSKLGVIVEFKQIANPAELQAAAESAVAQINTRLYEVELRQHGIAKILRVGLAFCGKEMALAHETRGLEH